MISYFFLICTPFRKNSLSMHNGLRKSFLFSILYLEYSAMLFLLAPIKASVSEKTTFLTHRWMKVRLLSDEIVPSVIAICFFLFSFAQINARSIVGGNPAVITTSGL